DGVVRLELRALLGEALALGLGGGALRLELGAGLLLGLLAQAGLLGLHPCLGQQVQLAALLGVGAGGVEHRVVARLDLGDSVVVLLALGLAAVVDRLAGGVDAFAPVLCEVGV